MNIEIKNIEDINKLVCQMETEQIEFKETTGQLERGMETLCAFLNGEGGTILYGVTDRGKITGQEISDQTKRSIAEAIQRIEPLPIIKISYVSIPDSEKKIIAIYAEELVCLNPNFIQMGTLSGLSFDIQDKLQDKLQIKLKHCCMLLMMNLYQSKR